MTDTAFLEDFRRTVDTASDRLRAIPDEEARRRPAPDKWSRKEIVGHLIDSASNNHGRFVRAQLQDHLAFPGYDQDEWVRVQRYQDRPWTDLVQLWQAFNHHIAHVMEMADADARSRLRLEHTLDEIAWEAVNAEQATTLDFFMRDYVAHLKHHLAQTEGSIGWVRSVG